MGHMDQESCGIFSELLRSLQKEFEERFQEVISFSKNFEVFSLPFSVQADDVDPEFQMELLKLQANTTLRQKFQDREYHSFTSFWTSMLLGSTLTSSEDHRHVWEHPFSLLKMNKSTLGSKITDENLRSTMRIVSAQGLEVGISSHVAAKRCQVSS